MLVVDGIFENGVFVPNKPLLEIKGRQNATLTISTNEETDRQERIMAWKQFGEAIINSDEKLEGEPDALREVHAIRLMLHDRTKDMTPEEHTAFFKGSAVRLLNSEKTTQKNCN